MSFQNDDREPDEGLTCAVRISLGLGPSGANEDETGVVFGGLSVASSSPRNTSPMEEAAALRLKAELSGLVLGEFTLDCLDGYNVGKIVYLCKEAANRANDAYTVLVSMAGNHGVDLSKDQQYQRGNRMDYTEDKFIKYEVNSIEEAAIRNDREYQEMD
mgnify:CR=1 FL=1